MAKQNRKIVIMTNAGSMACVFLFRGGDLVRVLVLLSSNPGNGFLVKLHTEELVQEIKSLIGKRSNSKAMVTALTKGRIEREVGHHDSNFIDAELVLTQDRACWNPARMG